MPLGMHSRPSFATSCYLWANGQTTHCATEDSRSGFIKGIGGIDDMSTMFWLGSVSTTVPECPLSGEQRHPYSHRLSCVEPSKQSNSCGKPYRTRGGDKRPCVFPRSRLRFTQKKPVQKSCVVLLSCDRPAAGDRQEDQAAGVASRSVLGSWVGVRRLFHFPYSLPRPAWF